MCRIAALHGYVITEQEVFAALFEGADDASSFLQRLVTAWDGWVPGGSTSTQAMGRLALEDFPALLVPEGAETAYIVRRREGSRWVIEDSQGQVSNYEPADEAVATILRAPTTASARGAAARAAQRSSASWFWREIRRYVPAFSEVAFGSLIANLLALGGSMFAMQVYDRVVPNLAYQTLWVLAAGVGIAILFETLIRAARAQLLDFTCKNIDLKLSDDLFRHLLAIRMNARPESLGTLAAQFRDFEVVRNFLTASTLFVIADAPFILIFILVIWLINPWVAVVPMIAVFLIMVMGIVSQWPLRKLSQLHVKESNERNGLLVESIDGIEMIKATGSEWQVARQYHSLSAQLSVDGLRMRSVSNLMMGSANSAQQLAYVGMVVVGAYMIGEGELTMGGLVACSILSGRILSPVSQVVALAFQWNHVRVALKALNGLKALPVDGPQGERAVVKESFAAQLTAEDLSFQYAQDGPVALSVSRIQFKPGERVAILGPTGSGKSTLLKVLSGIYVPHQGRVTLDGVDFCQLDPRQIRNVLAYLPQEVRLFQGSLRDNLVFGLVPPSDEEILAVARLTGIDRMIQQHPKGMGLQISEGGFGLSGGQRQSTALTRALLGQPKLILLDEPTASMDPQLEMHTMQSLMKALRPDQTLVCVTHKPAVLHAMDRLIVLDRGRVVLDGSREEVLRRLNAPQTAGASS